MSQISLPQSELPKVGAPRTGAKTLLESLGAIVAVIVLMAFSMPLMASMRQKSALHGELAQFRQLAVAQSLYTASTDGGIPMSAVTLIQGGYIDAKTVSSPADPSADGIANELDRGYGETSLMYRKLIVPYRSSYLGLREFHYPREYLDKYLKHEPNGGWLVSLSPTVLHDRSRYESWWSGTYRRLLLDGSVRTEQHQPVSIESVTGHEMAQHPLFLFVDGSQQWKRKLISGSH